MTSPISKPSGQVAIPPPPLKPDEAFTKMDANADGKVTSSEFKVAAPRNSANGGPPPGGPPPGGGAGGPPGAKGANTASVSKSTDLAATNTETP